MTGANEDLLSYYANELILNYEWSYVSISQWA